MDEKVSRYIVQLIQATREHYDVILGGSPRASMALLRCAQSFAAVHGFDFVLPDDVKQIAPLRARPSPDSPPGKPVAQKNGSPWILDEILNTVPVPQMPAGGPSR